MRPSLHTKCARKPQLGQVCSGIFLPPYLSISLVVQIDWAGFPVVASAVILILIIADCGVFQYTAVVAPFFDEVITGHADTSLADHAAAAMRAWGGRHTNILRNASGFCVAAAFAFKIDTCHNALPPSVNDAAALTIVAGAAVVHGTTAAAARTDCVRHPAGLAMKQVIFHDVCSLRADYFDLEQKALSNSRFRAS